jgi:hypothetical protein
VLRLSFLCPLVCSVFRQFPWDVAPNFDLVVPGVVAAKHDMPVELS